MPLFGKKKNESEKPKSSPSGSYPRASYPTQGQAAAVPQQVPQGFSQQVAPPPYTPQATQYQQPGFPQQGVPPPPGQQYAPQYGVPPQPGPQYAPQYGVPPAQPATVVVQGGFDAGARFDVSGPSIPPPPPGCMPNASQMAAAQGHNVVVTQKPDSFVTGGSDGGMVIW